MTHSLTSLIGALTVGLLSVTATADPIQWGGNDHWYEAVNVGTSGISWINARDTAVTRGGYLVTITSAQENDFAYSLVSDASYWFQDPVYHNGQGPWIGAYQTDKAAEPSGHWAWVTGEPWSYNNWAYNGSNAFEPNNSKGTEDFGQFFGLRTAAGKYWNDYPNNSQPADAGFVRGYIIEWNTNPIPEPTTVVLLGFGAIGLLTRRRVRVGC